MRNLLDTGSPMPSCGYRPISEASSEYGTLPYGHRVEKFICRRIENNQFVYFLLPDPRSWQRVEIAPGKFCIHRPAPEPYEPGMSAAPTSRRERNQQEEINF